MLLKDHRMPAEWEPHEATWLSWPKNKITWPGKLLKEVEGVYLQMMAGLLPGEKVKLLVDDAKTARRVRKLLEAKKVSLKNLVMHEIETVDTWIRDYGPIFVRPTAAEKMNAKTPGEDIGICEKTFTKWIFNAWGGKYSDLAEDNGVVDRIDELKLCARYDTGIILEGGSVDVNGKGTLLTTEQCLLNPNRNSELTKKEIEGYLKKFLGVRKIIWLKEGIEGDDTDGHVDDITRFVGPRVILTAMENDAKDKNRALLAENRQLLEKETDQDGKRFTIVDLPMPGKVGVGRGDDSSERLPASYANFYIGNSAVLLPVYSHANDKAAAKIVKKFFPGRKVIPIECTALVYGLGSIHCVTQQEPK